MRNWIQELAWSSAFPLPAGWVDHLDHDDDDDHNHEDDYDDDDPRKLCWNDKNHD